MIRFNYQTEFKLDAERQICDWLSSVVAEENYWINEVNYIFCDDEALHTINVDFLDHDNYTDVIGFDYSIGKNLQGDVYISIDRVMDNSKTYNVTFDNELARVMVHGLLHFCGYKDKSSVDQSIMVAKENYYLDKLHIAP